MYIVEKDRSFVFDLKTVDARRVWKLDAARGKVPSVTWNKPYLPTTSRINQSTSPIPHWEQSLARIHLTSPRARCLSFFYSQIKERNRPFFGPYFYPLFLMYIYIFISLSFPSPCHSLISWHDAPSPSTLYSFTLAFTHTCMVLLPTIQLPAIINIFFILLLFF